MSMLQTGIAEFTEQLASKAPVPGGGGASAYAAAIGIALGDMVGELTVGKKKYADVEEDIRRLMEQAQDLRVRLLACIDEDAEAFEPLSRAYGIPKDDPSRAEVMESCLKEAAAVPLKILDLCGEAMDLLAEFAGKGSVLVVSDAATGIMICQGALYGAAVNVRVNTKLMKDREYAEEINRHVAAQMEKYLPLAEKVYNEVNRRFD